MAENEVPGVAKLIGLTRHAVHQALERFHDWRLGVYTNAEIHLPEVGIDDKDCHCYAATNYRRFKQVVAELGIDPQNEGFIDYGSGLARVVMLAAAYPFKHVIGLEVSEQLHTLALKNIEATRASFKCSRVELINADARTYTLPADITVLYFWNPFSENILRAVIEQLRISLATAPRKVVLCYASPYRPNCLDNVIEEYPWLSRRKTCSLGTSMHITLADAWPRTSQGPT